jgi:hypothetical protein
VVTAERVQFMKDGTLSTHGLHILTFDKARLPQEVYVGYMRYSVRTYYSKPLRCSKCCNFGHQRGYCDMVWNIC